ncbi:MAG: hypothetical protein JXB08_05010 [Bacilli bacterium]|nr:hypothetical protein [Bacilli bacterium]MBN2877460.1 hypothetical protein [Bacilli bacterium]
MKQKLQTLTTIVFYGSVWGIIEATLGWALHMIPGISLYTSGAVLFSFAGLILYKAYKKTNSRLSLIYIAFVASAIKAIDFFLPNLSVFKVINPMLSIMMEALGVFIVITLIDKKDLWSRVGGFVMASLSWRLLFYAYMTVQGVTYLSSTAQYLEFFGLYMLGSAALGLGFLYLNDFITKTFTTKAMISRFKPVFAAATFLVALVITYFI